MNLIKLLNIQSDLKAPKSQYNNFGKYKYRNCEDILEAVKPLCKANRATLTLSDDIVNIGNRFYVQATASLYDAENGELLQSVKAFAREEDMKKGMDGSQVTGSASSYARKYALNGLFNIDDTKDADNFDNSEKPTKQAVKPLKEQEPTKQSNEPLTSRTEPNNELIQALETELTIKGTTRRLKDLSFDWLERYHDNIGFSEDLRRKLTLVYESKK